MIRASLTARVFVVTVLMALMAAGLATFVALQWRGSLLLPALAILVVVLPLAWFGAKFAAGSWSRVVRAVRDGVMSLRDHDFSMSITPMPEGELKELVLAYNSLGDLLRRERLDLYQRELLLDTVIQTTPLVMVLTDSAGRIVYSNIAARQLFYDGRKLEGLDFQALVAAAATPLREALNATQDTLFTIDVGSEPQVYHLSQRGFLLNAQPHRLILLKQLTRELAAQEVAIWKKVIRVIAHELNNSLAPISSLVHSGRLLARELEAAEPAQLERVFTTIGERTAHLASFIDGYARFAKLPRPRVAPVSWAGFLAGLEGALRFRSVRPIPERQATFDAGQLEQVMINLLKNAAESGSPADDITVTVTE